jgi:tripartite-type tricarboxylate transporter receptor subunit TctC
MRSVRFPCARSGVANRPFVGLRPRLAALLFAACALLGGAAGAQTWPAKTLTIVSPFPAGGITDLLSRIVGAELSRALGQQVVIENRTGAGGAIALASVAKAPPDGYTLVMGGSAPSALVPAINRNVTYTPKDFEPIGYVAGLPIVLVAHPSLPAANLRELVAHARANDGKLNCGHHGIGTGTHLACVQFARYTGTKIPDIGYKGAPQVNIDLLANRIQLYFATLPTQLQYIRTGQLKAYGIASPERVPSAADIPTLQEQGVKGLDMDSWNALYAPAGTPRAIVQRLAGELVRILNQPETRAKIESTGSLVRPGTPEALGKLTEDEYATFRRIATEANIRVD